MKKTNSHAEDKQRAVADRKRAEEMLKTQARVLESMVEGVNVSDESANIFFTNQAFDTMFGYERGELINQHVSVLNAASPEENSRLVEEVRAQLEKVGWWRGEFNNIRKDGTLFTTSARISALEVSGKTYLISVQEDITERKRAEEALHESEERYRELVEDINDVIYEVDASGRITYISPVAAEVSGYSPTEIIGRSIVEFVPPDEVSARMASFRDGLAGRSIPTEFSLLTKSGEIRWIHTFGRVIREGDRIAGFRGVLTDITERKRADEALRDSEERYRDLYDNAPVAYFAVGADGHIARANRRASELLGYSIDSLIGRPVLDLYSDTPAGKDKAKRVVERFWRGRETHDEEMEMRRADGSPVWVSLTVHIVRDAGGQPVETRSMVLDITERKRAEEALRMAQEELESGAELQAQGADAYGFSLRELTVLNLVASGRSDKEIGTTLGISARTVQKHVEKLCKKMGVSTRTEASVQALRQGLID